MQFEYKDWMIEISGNKVTYWSKKSPKEVRNIYHSGVERSLVKAFLDEVGLTLEEESKGISEVLQAIRDALTSRDFTQEEKTSLGTELARLEALTGKTE